MNTSNWHLLTAEGSPCLQGHGYELTARNLEQALCLASDVGHAVEVVVGDEPTQLAAEKLMGSFPGLCIRLGY